MVTLGFTAITPVVLIAQFSALLLRLNAIHHSLRALITDQPIANLEAGLAPGEWRRARRRGGVAGGVVKPAGAAREAGG
jgi:hypothetical protein